MNGLVEREPNQLNNKEPFLIIMGVFLTVCGIISLYTNNHLPTNLLNNVCPGKLPLLASILRGIFFSEAPHLIDLQIALNYLAASCFLATVIILIYSLFKPHLIKWVKNDPSRFTILLILTLTTIFLFSISIRVHNFNKPIGARYGMLSSDTLIRLKIWKDQGAWNNFFVPNDTFPGAANNNIQTFCQVFSAEGKCFYLSYPPLAIILPYLPILLFNFQPSPAYLLIINLALHLIAAIFIFLTTVLLSKRSSGKKNYPAAILAYSFYLFAPVLLIMHSESYFADMVIMPFFVGGIYFFLCLLEKPQNHNYKILLLTFLIFLACYTEWLGVLFSGIICLYSVLKRKHTQWRVIFLLSALACLAALILTAGQFISAVDPASVWEQIKLKILFRSGFSNTAQESNFYRYIMINPSAWLRFVFNYLCGYGLLPIIIISALVIKIKGTKNRLNKLYLNTKAYFPFILVAGLPVLLHHLLLFQWSTLHYFSSLKAAPLITVIGGILIIEMINKKNSAKIFWQLATGLTITLFVFSYLSKTSNQTNFFAIQGRRIANLSNSEDVLFIRSESSATDDIITWRRTILGYYAQRNISPWVDLSNAKQLLQKNNVANGVLFELRKDVDDLTLKYARFNQQSSEEDVAAGFKKNKN